MKSQLNLKKAIFTFLFVIIGVAVFAQSGKISGKVSDKKTGETLIGVTVKIKGTTKGASTDANGQYVIGSLATGTYILEVSYMGYTAKDIPGIKVTDGKVTVMNTDMVEQGGTELKGVSVTAKINRESEAALNLERRNSTVVLQKIGAQEMTRKGLSNVGEGVTKIAGVSVVGNKNVFVRGLGDRYNNTMLNGMPIPSTNPDLKLIPLDIFPTSVVKNIGVTKSYSPELYGDFSGGNIDILTKDYPEVGFFKVGISSGYNSITTGKDFYSTESNAMRFFGFDRSDRKMPSDVKSTRTYSSLSNPNIKPDFVNWTPEMKSAPVASGFSFSGGNSYDLGNDRKFGFLANLAYKNDYRFNEGISAIFNAQQSPDYLYNTTRYNYTTNTSGLLNFYYKASAKSNYALTAIYVNDSGNDIFDQTGYKGDQATDIYARRNNYVQNSLLTTQFSGNNELASNMKLKYALSYSNIEGSTPDRVQNSFFDNGNGSYSFIKNNTSDQHRFFADLTEHDFSGNVALDILSKTEGSAFRSIQVGLQGRRKDRVFGARQIDTKLGLNPILALNEVDRYLNNDNLGNDSDPSKFLYQESYYAPNDYEADLTIGASYFNLNFEWNKKLKLVAGLRAEYSRQNIYFKEGGQAYDAAFKVNTLDNIDFLPAATLKYTVSEKSNMLFAASRTISRPQFVEAAPFRYNVGFGIAEGEGNPNLVNSSNYNADLKYEIYPSANELFAVSVFGKYIDKPIELSQVNSADPLFTYINTDNAILAGIEFEYNRNIGSIFGSSSKALKNMSLGFNGSYIYSKIEISDATIQNLAKPIAPTNRSRPLFGASPYLINFDYSYKHNWSETSNTMFTLTYNVFGKRLFVAGAQQAGDIYEMPVNSLDFIVNTKINRRIGLDLNFGNILNPTIKFQQEYSNNNLTYNQFKKGMNVGLNLNYTF